MTYVDGFIIPLATKKLDAYRKLARKASKVWIEHGALEYRECVAEDIDAVPGLTSFRDMAKTKRKETVIFSWIVYRSKAHRNRVNAKAVEDPRIAKLKKKDMPFDVERMAYGGFEKLVQAMAEA